MSRIKLTRDEVFDAIDCGVVVDRDTWRHGTIDTTVFKRDGKFYCITVEVHSTEGVQVYGDHVTAFEVRREPVEVSQWVAVENHKPVGESKRIPTIDLKDEPGES